MKRGRIGGVGLSCLVLWVLISGCGGRSDLSQVSGRVTLDGQPLGDALVVFTPLTGGRPAAARTDASGNYTLVYDRQGTGAIQGEHMVTISTRVERELADGTVEDVPERVPAQFNFRSELTANIQEGLNEFNFDLDSEGEVYQSEEDAW